jgi:hypothetical protein
MREFPGGYASDFRMVSLQELVRTPVKPQQASDFRDLLDKNGVRFHDFNKYIRDDQVSFAETQVGFNALGRLVMIDYGARHSH